MFWTDRDVVTSLSNPVLQDLVDKFFAANLPGESKKKKSLLHVLRTLLLFEDDTDECLPSELSDASASPREKRITRATWCFHLVAVQGDTNEWNIRYHFSYRVRRISIHYNYIRGMDHIWGNEERRKTHCGGNVENEKGKVRGEKRLIARNSRGCCS